MTGGKSNTGKYKPPKNCIGKNRRLANPDAALVVFEIDPTKIPKDRERIALTIMNSIDSG